MTTDDKHDNSVDCIFDLNGTHTVLVKRGNDPFKGYWALPGGRRLRDEDLEDAVIREINSETGAGAQLVSKDIPTTIRLFGKTCQLEQIRSYSSGTDPRGGNTTTYAIQLKGEPNKIMGMLQGNDDAVDIGLFRIDQLPELAFEHERFLSDYFLLKRYKSPKPTTDVIIEYSNEKKEGIVLITRRNPPIGIAIPGGYAEYGLSLEENAVKEALEETGLEVIIQNPELPLCVHSSANRDPRGHMISVTYIGKGFGTLRKGDFDDAKDPQLYTLREVAGLIKAKKLVFDHDRILTKYLEYKGVSL